MYTEPKEGPLSSPGSLEEFPLVFNSGARVRTDFRSQHHGGRSLAEEAPHPLVLVNTVDAAERGIDDGDEVDVVTARGSVTMRARVTEDIVRGSVDAAMGGGGPVGPDAWRRANVNALTDLSNHDPISGFPVYKTLLCDVRPSGRQGYTAPRSPWSDGIRQLSPAAPVAQGEPGANPEGS